MHLQSHVLVRDPICVLCLEGVLNYIKLLMIARPEFSVSDKNKRDIQNMQ